MTSSSLDADRAKFLDVPSLTNATRLLKTAMRTWQAGVIDDAVLTREIVRVARHFDTGGQWNAKGQR